MTDEPPTWGGRAMVKYIRTSRGNVFAFEHDDRLGQFSAVGPLTGGRSVVLLESTKRVFSREPTLIEARKDLLVKLDLLGY